MTLTTIRTPRGSVLIRRNECINPSVETNDTLWTYSWFGTGAGTNQRFTDGGLSGSGYLRKTFTTTSTESGDVGFSYQHDGWSGDWTEKIASAYLRPVNIDGYGRVSLQSYNSSGGLISRQDGNPQYLGNTVWSRVSASFKCPPGTVSSKVSFWMVTGRTLAAGFRLDLDDAFIEPGTVLGSYFDGDTYGNGNGSQFTTWAGTHHASQSLLWDADPASQVSPTLVLGWDQGGNGESAIVHRLLSGAVQIVARKGTPRSGTLKLFFGTDRIAALSCAAQHRISGVWAYTDSDLPETSMSYVVTGPVHAYNDDDRAHWTVEIPFSETS